MIRNKLSVFVPVGLSMLSVRLIIRFLTHGNYPHFGGGFLLGAGLVFIIAGALTRIRPQGKS